MKYYARTKTPYVFTSEEDCQPLETHLQNVSKYAASFAKDFQCETILELLGVVHDFGKYQTSFQDRLLGKSKQKIDHSSAGAKLILEKYSEYKLLSELLAMIVSSHHTGLPNSGTKLSIGDGTFWAKMNGYLGNHISIYPNLPDSINLRKPVTDNPSFYMSMWIRMLFSCLVDADYTDSEEYVRGVKRKVVQDSIPQLLKKFEQSLPINDGREINILRLAIRLKCIECSTSQQGLFTLTVPTGGGKTISSLAFALNHAKQHNLKRIIYVIPYTSIIEQNARAIAAILGDENVLEHHSNVDIAAESDENSLSKQWATENWDIPVIITTNVQFFESLFCNKPSKLRKVHNISKSVIVLDEAQMLPLQYISPCMYSLSELICNYGSSVLLCSATQPALENYKYEKITTTEIIPQEMMLDQKFERVKFSMVGKKTDIDIANDMLQSNQTITIVNSRRHAYDLHKILDETRENTYHLSTLMYPHHRLNTIQMIKSQLMAGEDVYVVSTQLIEAGVDLDFKTGFRSLAGIDSIIQAAGRVNREGKLIGGGKMQVFEPAEAKMPKAIEVYASIAKQVINKLGDNAFSTVGVEFYFKLLHKLIEENQIIDHKGILGEFDIKAATFNFENVATKFKIIENIQKNIVIPSDKICSYAVDRIENRTATRNDYRIVQKYTVPLYVQEMDSIIDVLSLIDDDLYVLRNMNYYSEKTGLNVYSKNNLNAECTFL